MLTIGGLTNVGLTTKGLPHGLTTTAFTTTRLAILGAKQARTVLTERAKDEMFRQLGVHVRPTIEIVREL